MSENEEKVMIICTHAGDNPEKAAMPFVMANGAMAMDVKIAFEPLSLTI